MSFHWIYFPDDFFVSSNEDNHNTGQIFLVLLSDLTVLRNTGGFCSLTSSLPLFQRPVISQGKEKYL